MPLLLGVIWIATRSGEFLVVDRPSRSDVILVLGGDRGDARYRRALELLKAGYGSRVVVNRDASYRRFGETQADRLRRYVAATAGNLADRISVCGIAADSTVTEAVESAGCLDALGASSALIVTSEYHTRRALSTFATMTPERQWSVAAVREPEQFGLRWWARRSWTLTSALEWEKLLWWQLERQFVGDDGGGARVNTGVPPRLQGSS
ncbi:MAG: YdcF family protein [Candidatus Korobacteraceae bacterium]